MISIYIYQSHDFSAPNSQDFQYVEDQHDLPRQHPLSGPRQPPESQSSTKAQPSTGRHLAIIQKMQI